NGPAPGRMGTLFLVVPCRGAGVECLRGPSARAVVNRNPIGGRRGGRKAVQFNQRLSAVVRPTTSWKRGGRDKRRTTADRRLMLATLRSCHVEPANSQPVAVPVASVGPLGHDRDAGCSPRPLVVLDHCSRCLATFVWPALPVALAVHDASSTIPDCE